MRLIIFFILFFGISFSCAKKHYPSGFYKSVFEFIGEIDKLTIDTTFAYSIIDTTGFPYKPINLSLPNTLGGEDVRGIVKLYSLIDKSKNLVEIEFLSVELYKKRKPFFYFDIEKYKPILETNYYKNFKAFIFNALKNYPLKVNRSPSKEVHKTFCLILIP